MATQAHVDDQQARLLLLLLLHRHLLMQLRQARR
jgi:hypothetical protein